MSKVLVISASLRDGSNSEALAKAFADGAKSKGSDVNLISLKNKRIAFCRGCLACQTRGECVINDDAIAIAAAMKSADIIAFATPIYYYGLAGQLKTLLDRANSLFAGDYNFRRIYLLTAAAENLPSTDEGAVRSLSGWIACYDKCEFAGKVFAGGVDKPNAIKNHPALARAFELGERA